MSNEESEDAVKAAARFDRRFLKAGRRRKMSLLPEAYHAPLGKIMIYWADFENIFDTCLGALVNGQFSDGQPKDYGRYERQPFREKARIFITICEEWVSDFSPKVAADLILIAERSIEINSDRSTLSHGNYAFTIPAFSDVATNCRVVNRRTGEELKFDMEYLVSIYHEISELSAELVKNFKEIGDVGGDVVIVDDEWLLSRFDSDEN